MRIGNNDAFYSPSPHVRVRSAPLVPLPFPALVPGDPHAAQSAPSARRAGDFSVAVFTGNLLLFRSGVADGSTSAIVTEFFSVSPSPPAAFTFDVTSFISSTNSEGGGDSLASPSW